MHIQYENFTRILDASVHNKPVSFENPIDYSELLSIAQAHNVYALVCEKLSECQEFASSSIYNRAIIKSMHMIVSQTRRTSEFLNLYQALAEAGLYPIVMKGIVCRQLYGEQGDHRPSCDEDILIRKTDFYKVKAVLIKHGCVPERENITESQLDELQEVSFYHKDTGLHIEVHTNPIGRENDIRDRMNDCFKEVFTNSIEMEIQGTIIQTMGYTDHFLFLVLHAFKHMMVSGFGIRQVLDILLFYEKYEGEINKKYVFHMLEKLTAIDFFSDLVCLGNRYLGFNFMPVREEHCVDDLLEDLMDNGAFGNTTQAQGMARTMINAAVEKHESRKVFNLVRTVFPSRKYMMAGYPQLVERSWLLPLCWVQRWRHFLKYRKVNGNHIVAESIEISSRKIKLMKKYGII